ncbi:hypothetical protein JB92DRAFT_3149740 [Gautieria morchelliformis]|nr:hypothetical protein JB92DRAFT_3149740 [Gautieria morchelliformis]
MDVEALQAQIDLSNSIAYDLVSSWVKPSTSSSKTSVSHAISRELEEYSKRPPRLGLGATVSKSTLATSREGAKLKGKLAGRKRRRHDGSDRDSEVGAKKPRNNEEDEDELESRSAAISTKEVPVNGMRGLRQGKHEDRPTAASLKEKSKDGAQQLRSSSTLAGITDAPIHSISSPSLNTRLTSPEARPPPSHHQASSPVSSHSSPLLNLHGPPGDHVGDEALTHPTDGRESPKKKKRRRRRKKGSKSHGSEVTV